MFWNQDERKMRFNDDADMSRVDVDDSIKSHIPKISFRHSFRTKRNNGFEKKTKIINNDAVQDLSLEEQIQISQNIIDLQNKLGVTIHQKNGQRKLGGPPPDWQGPPPDRGSEVFVGRIPRNVYEDVLYPIFSKIGKIYEMRLMMNFSGTNRGYCFVMYKTPELAQKAIKILNNYEITPGWPIGVVPSVNNCRLHITRLPSTVDSKTIIKKIWPLCKDVEKILIYTHLNKEKTKEAFMSFETHRAAAMARRRLVPVKDVLFPKSIIRIEWAPPDVIFTNVVVS